MAFALLDALFDLSFVVGGLGFDLTITGLESSLKIAKILEIRLCLIGFAIFEALFPVTFVDDVFVLFGSVVVDHDAIAISLIVGVVALIRVLIRHYL